MYFNIYICFYIVYFGIIKSNSIFSISVAISTTRTIVTISFIILPLFAMANTAIEVTTNWTSNLTENYSLGIFFGLVFGKPMGITLFTWLSVKLKICHLPSGVKWSHIIGAACLGGIGFTMSIFVTLLAFNDEVMINSAKLIILFSSITAGLIGYLWLKFALKK